MAVLGEKNGRIFIRFFTAARSFFTVAYHIFLYFGNSDTPRSHYLLGFDVKGQGVKSDRAWLYSDNTRNSAYAAAHSRMLRTEYDL